MVQNVAVKSQLLLIVVGLILPMFCGVAREYRATSAADIERIASLEPGDAVVLAGAIWKNQTVVLAGKGTAEKPIIFRAETTDKVALTGTSSVVIDGEHVIVSGLALKEGTSTKDGIIIRGRNCRLTESSVEGGQFKFFVHIFGLSNRMDHCFLAGKTSEGPTLQIEVEGRPNYHRIDHNHFGRRPPLGRNGGETMRVGYSHQSMTNSATVVEENLFENCDGEIEIISNKSCENIYRFNKFIDCAGMLTLRHGNRCRVEGNVFLGHHKKGSGGIRVIGEGHTIISNYVEGVEQGAFWITSGIPNSPLNGYFQARDCVIAFNTVLDSRGPCIELDAGLGRSGRTLRPQNITIATNVFVVGKGGTLLKGTEGEGWKWAGNVAWPEQANLSEAQGKGIRLSNEAEKLGRK